MDFTCTAISGPSTRITRYLITTDKDGNRLGSRSYRDVAVIEQDGHRVVVELHILDSIKNLTPETVEMLPLPAF